jgi:hypothetical protein
MAVCCPGWIGTYFLLVQQEHFLSYVAELRYTYFKQPKLRYAKLTDFASAETVTFCHVQARVCVLCFRGSVRTKLKSVTCLKMAIFVVTAAITPNAAGIRTLVCCCVHVLRLDPQPHT